MSFKTDYDSWPWNGGYKEQARNDAKFGRKNRDLYAHYKGGNNE